MLDFLVSTSMILLIVSIASGFYTGVVLSMLMLWMVSQIY